MKQFRVVETVMMPENSTMDDLYHELCRRRSQTFQLELVGQLGECTVVKKTDMRTNENGRSRSRSPATSANKVKK